MKVNISQQVIPRQRAQVTPSWKTPSRRSWKNRVPRSTSYQQQGSINSKTLTLTLAITVMVSLASLSFFYLSQVLNTASQSSGVQALEERMVELQEQQRELELEGAQLRSIETIERSVGTLNLIETNRFAYLKDTKGSLAALPE